MGNFSEYIYFCELQDNAFASLMEKRLQNNPQKT